MCVDGHVGIGGLTTKHKSDDVELDYLSLPIYGLAFSISPLIFYIKQRGKETAKENTSD